VEHGGGGSTAAAPIARDVMLQALAGGEPPLEAYPTADRSRIKVQQEQLRDVQPQAAIDGKDQA
jgi:penicillin-binding protein 2